MAKNKNFEMYHFATCPIKHTLNIIGGKWKFNILWQLIREEPIRYNELKRRVEGITNMMLTQCLQELEQDGIINRLQYNEIPPRVEYSLTQEGKNLEPILQAMAVWGVQHIGKEACVRQLEGALRESDVRVLSNVSQGKTSISLK